MMLWTMAKFHHRHKQGTPIKTLMVDFRCQSRVSTVIPTRSHEALPSKTDFFGGLYKKDQVSFVGIVRVLYPQMQLLDGAVR